MENARPPAFTEEQRKQSHREYVINASDGDKSKEENKAGQMDSVSDGQGPGPVGLFRD